MARAYITTTAPATIALKARRVIVQVNAALTGTVTVADGSTTTAVITNPTVGSRYEYWDFATSVVVTASTTCDVTVSADGSHGAR